MATSGKIFSLEGRALKLDTAQDLEIHIGPLRAMADVEEVRILGNTLGVEACKLLGEVLATKKSLKVSEIHEIFFYYRRRRKEGKEKKKKVKKCTR